MHVLKCKAIYDPNLDCMNEFGSSKVIKEPFKSELSFERFKSLKNQPNQINLSLGTFIYNV